MVIDAVRRALGDLLAPETRNVFWKILGITFLILIALWFGLRSLFVAYGLPWIDVFFPDVAGWQAWLVFFALIVAGLGLALVLALMISPVTALVAGLFLDDVAEAVEARDYPGDPPGRAMPTVPALVASIKFLGVVIVGNAIALMLLFVPGVNLVAFFLLNGYLLGREYFEFAASRFRPVAEAKEFRAKHASTVFMAGIAVSVFLAIPIVNLLTPLFAGALMVHLHKALSARDSSFASSFAANDLRR